MRAGLLRECIKIQKPVVATDGYGANDVEWQDYIFTRAYITYSEGNRINDNNEVTFAYIVNFDIRIYHDINERMRVIYNGKKYRILSIQQHKDIQKLSIKTELINE